MIGLRLFEMLRGRFAAPRKLIVVGVELSDQSGHCFNELLGYKNAAPTLGLLPFPPSRFSSHCLIRATLLR
jgi:hypothetical protein